VSAQPVERAPISSLGMFRPVHRSRKAREAEGAMVRRLLRNYDAMLAAQARAEKDTDVPGVQAARRRALMDLLHARAAIERALYLETGGRLGDLNSTPGRTVQTLPKSSRTYNPMADSADN